MDPRWGVRIPQSVIRTLVFVLFWTSTFIQAFLEPESEAAANSPWLEDFAYWSFVAMTTWLFLRFPRTASVALGFMFLTEAKLETQAWASYSAAALLLGVVAIDLILGRNQQRIATLPTTPGSEIASDGARPPIAFRAQWSAPIIVAGIGAATGMVLATDGSLAIPSSITRS